MECVKSIKDMIKRIDIWDPVEVTYRELSGGITNHNYVCRAGDRKYVLRVPGSGTNILINRDHEYSNSNAAARAGISPVVRCVVKPEGAMVIDFIEGKVLHPDVTAADDEKIVKIVEAIKKVHDKVKFEPVTFIFDLIRKYTQIAKDAKAFSPHDFDWMLSVSNAIEKAMERNKVELAACHNDLLSENFVVDENERLWILDWEYGGMNDPYFDLGDFAVEHPLTRKQEELIIKTYCGQMRPQRLYRLLLHKLTADLWWGLWAMIQVKISRINFDFYTYSLGRYARFRRNYHDRDFDKWLEEV